MRRVTTWRALGLLFILGGAVRLFADQALFAAFGIGQLWVEAPYFIYVYKVLGAFVILTGLVLWSLGGKAGARSGSATPVKWGMVIVGGAMLGSGLSLGLAAKFWVIDVVFSWIVAILLQREGARVRRDKWYGPSGSVPSEDVAYGQGARRDLQLAVAADVSALWRSVMPRLASVRPRDAKLRRVRGASQPWSVVVRSLPVLTVLFIALSQTRGTDEAAGRALANLPAEWHNFRHEVRGNDNRLRGMSEHGFRIVAPETLSTHAILYRCEWRCRFTNSGPNGYGGPLIYALFDAQGSELACDSAFTGVVWPGDTVTVNGTMPLDTVKAAAACSARWRFICGGRVMKALTCTELETLTEEQEEE